MAEKKQGHIASRWFYWRFFEMTRFLFSVWKNYIDFVGHYFSISLLVATLFKPWRKYIWEYPRGFDAGKYLGIFISNIVSRILGACARLVFIAIGIIAYGLVIAIGIIGLACWIVIPLVSAILIFLLITF